MACATHRLMKSCWTRLTFTAEAITWRGKLAWQSAGDAADGIAVLCIFIKVSQYIKMQEECANK